MEGGVLGLRPVQAALLGLTRLTTRLATRLATRRRRRRCFESRARLHTMDSLAASSPLAAVQSYVARNAGTSQVSTGAILRWACRHERLDALEWAFSIGLTADEARADGNYALRWACRGGHLAIVERLISLGLGADDARAGNNEALRSA